MRIRPPRVTGLSRERLLLTLGDLWEHRLGLVVAPAGSGKSTLLAQFAATAGAPVAWYRAESSDIDAGVMLGHLGTAWRASVDPSSGPWTSVEEAAVALDAAPPDRAALIIDDLHVLRGTDAEAALEQLLDYLPDGVVVLAATRALPQFNLSRLRVSGALVEVVADDLRFRSWEVERLFREVYGEPLRPEDLAELARRTEGWAAGLQLFHLATRGKSRDERQRAVAGLLAHRSRLVREYLARNVLDELDDDLRDFLLRTAVLGRLNGTLCDELLGRSGSATVLAELEAQQLFTIALDEPGWYRYHEVLRSHAEAVFIEETGAQQARTHSRRAGALLEGAGAFAEALQAYCRADDWGAAERLLALSGEELSAGPGAWVDALPAAMLEHDPWVMLAAARRHLAAGRLDEAIELYRQAEAAFGDVRTADLCRVERQAVATWAEPAPNPPPDWSGILRLATVRQPLAAAAQAPASAGPAGMLVAGIATMLAGRVRDARATLSRLLDGDTSGSVAAGASLGLGVCALLSADESAPDLLRRAVEVAEAAGVPWLAALGREMAAAEVAGADVALLSPGGDDDVWGGAFISLLRAWALLPAAAAIEPALEAAATFTDLGAPVLQAWSLAIAAVAAAAVGDASAGGRAVHAARLARATMAAGPAAMAQLAHALLDGAQSAAATRALDHLADLGLAPAIGLTGAQTSAAPSTSGWQPVGGAAEATAPPVDITLFGQFSIALDGQPVDLSAVKPRVRSLLRLLAADAGRPVHRERIIDALWPDADTETGTRNLQVAISTLRQVLEPGVARGESALLLRDGDAYVLALPPGAHVDAAVFSQAVSEGHESARRGDDERAIAALTHALELYAGDLVPEEGPAEWLNDQREACRTGVVEAAYALAELHARRGELVAAAFACERGLRVDRYRDGLWQLLIDLYERGGEAAAAARARSQYDAVLTELGVGPSAAD